MMTDEQAPNHKKLALRELAKWKHLDDKLVQRANDRPSGFSMGEMVKLCDDRRRMGFTYLARAISRLCGEDPDTLDLGALQRLEGERDQEQQGDSR